VLPVDQDRLGNGGTHRPVLHVVDVEHGVEAAIDGSGVTTLSLGDLPAGVVGLTQEFIAWQERSVDAALSGDSNLVVQAIMTHPWVRSTSVADHLADELLAAHAAFLPQFHETDRVAV
jgi:6-phospho-beta-glucosidase